MGFISVLSLISKEAGHTAQLPFPQPHCCPSHKLRKTNGIKQSVNIFFQLRKVKGFASLFQETRGIQPFIQHSSEHQRKASSSEEAGPFPWAGLPGIKCVLGQVGAGAPAQIYTSVKESTPQPSIYIIQAKEKM